MAILFFPKGKKEFKKKKIKKAEVLPKSSWVLQMRNQLLRLWSEILTGDSEVENVHVRFETKIRYKSRPLY